MDYKNILLVGIALLMPVSIWGQNEKKKSDYAHVTVRNDTILVVKGNKDMRVKIYEEMDDSTIKEGKKDQSFEIYSGIFIDRISNEDKAILDVLPFVPKKKKVGHFNANYPFFYLSFGRAVSDAVSYSSCYPQRSGKSVDWGFNIYNSEIQMDKRGHWGLTWALGFAYSRYVFDANAALEKTDGKVVWQSAAEGIDYQKSWMRYWSFRIPVCIEWQKKIKGSHLYLSAGPEVEMRFAMKSKAKYGGHDHTLTNNPNGNVLGANLMVQAGYGCLSFVGRFGLTPLMDKSRAPQLYHSSIGFGINF